MTADPGYCYLILCQYMDPKGNQLRSRVTSFTQPSSGTLVRMCGGVKHTLAATIMSRTGRSSFNLVKVLCTICIGPTSPIYGNPANVRTGWGYPGLRNHAQRLNPYPLSIDQRSCKSVGVLG